MQIQTKQNANTNKTKNINSANHNVTNAITSLTSEFNDIS